MSTVEGHDVEHRSVPVTDGQVHVAIAGQGSPVLLVHGFPETWRVFEGLMARLADRHRVLAVDLPGFGDSSTTAVGSSDRLAAALVEVLEALDVGPVHLLGQDVSGALTYRIAVTRPDLVASWVAVETLLPGFGFEALADAAHGGAWYIGMLAAPGAAEVLLPGREREFLVDQVLAPQVRDAAVLTPALLDDLADSYARPGGFDAASALYRSLLDEAEGIRSLARRTPTVPTLAIGGSAGQVVADLLRPAVPDLTEETVPGVGHYVALEAPALLAEVLLPFFAAHEPADPGTRPHAHVASA